MTLGKFAVAATAVACVAALVISIWPGWLNHLLIVAVLLGVFAFPVVLLGAAVVVFAQFRRGDLRLDRIWWKYGAAVFAMLFFTYAVLKLYVPRRISFALSQSSFQNLVDDRLPDDDELNRRVGLYYVDEYLIDERGGAYFRVYAGADGIGPDTMSYGFCYQPNDEGSPFGAAYYRTFRLGDGWYWFRASNDW